MRPVRAKALIINAFALTGRIVFGGFLPQGVALGYVLLPLRGVLLRLLTHPLLFPCEGKIVSSRSCNCPFARLCRLP